MSLLLQCPRCGFAYLRPGTESSAIITCRRCHCVFGPGVPSSPDNSAPPDPPLPLAAPIIVSSFSSDFVIQPEPVHEVEHIEVLDTAAPEAPPVPSGQLGPLELGERAPAKPLDEVDVIEPPPPVTNESPDDTELVLTPEEPAVAETVPVVQEPRAPLDRVEVVEEPPADVLPPNVPATPAVGAERIDAPVSPVALPPPVPRRTAQRQLDIQKRERPRGTATPLGVWLGFGVGVVGVFLLVLLVLIVLRSGSSAPQPAANAGPGQQQAGAASLEQFLPSKNDWPTPPDQRGPAPWHPPALQLKALPAATTDMAGLLGYWPLDEGQGSQVADASQNGHQSTLVGGWWIDGVRGKALLFDGRRDYLELGHSPKLNFGANAPFTIAGWMTTHQQDGYVLAFRNPRDFAPVIQIKLNGGSICGVVRADGSEQGEARVGLAPAADGRWHHFALMRHVGGNVECFLDGKSLDKRSGSNSQGPITTTVRAVGCERSWFLSQQAPAAYCACAIDELCIFERALTAKEIASLAGK